ncbi:MAG: hypothetical protein AAF183_16645 [Pseudomonadota bacterium]
MTDEMNNTPAPGTAQTNTKAWVGALAAMASAAVQWAATGEMPDPESITAWGATLGSAAFAFLMVWLIPNRAK